VEGGDGGGGGGGGGGRTYLGGDTDGAGVEVALAHHDAAHRDQGAGGETEFFRAEEGGDNDVAACGEGGRESELEEER